MPMSLGALVAPLMPRAAAVCCVLAAAALLAAGPAAAADGDAALDWTSMAIQLAGGLALFLYGMDKMAEALKIVAGDRMRHILGRLTTNRLLGVVTGAGVTAVIQSSSVTTVMLVSFVAAGLMSLTQAVGVIFGANIGTTITAQIIAFKVTDFALLFVAAGFVLEYVGRTEPAKTYGALVMGLGLIFFGLAVMSAGMAPLRAYDPFIALMREASNPALGILIAAVFTAAVQSSSATTGVIIALASQGLVTLETGIALAFGANIGTCVTAALAAIGKPRAAVRVAVAHIAFNVLGVFLAVWFIEPFADMVRSISPAASDLSGYRRLAAEVPRQVANAHTIFNVGATVLFLPFAALIARFAEFVVPDRPAAADDEQPSVKQPRFLDDALLETPALALGRARMEIGRMGESVADMVGAILPAILNRDADAIRRVAAMDADVDNLYEHIVDYLRDTSLEGLSKEQSQQFTELIDIATNFENIGDIIETDLVAVGLHSIDEKVMFSAQTRGVLTDLSTAVAEAVTMANHAAAADDRDAAAAVIQMKHRISDLADAAAAHCARRLVAVEPNRLNTFAREVETIERYRRIYYFAKRIAKAVAAVADEDEAAPKTPATPATPDAPGPGDGGA
jgi:phosphate:Na+ symporter